MAVTVTSRGTSEAGPTTATSLTTASGSFTPAASSVLVCLIDDRISAGPFPPTISDTIGDSGGTAWSSAVENHADGTTWTTIWTRSVGTGPGAGVITVNSSTDTTSTSRYVISTYVEVGGVTSATPAQTQNGHNTATPLTITFAATPDAAGLVLTCAFANNGAGNTVPSGYTSLDLRVQANGDAWGAAYKNGSAAAGVSWSTLSATSNAACAIELTASVGAPTTYIAQAARIVSPR